MQVAPAAENFDSVDQERCQPCADGIVVDEEKASAAQPKPVATASGKEVEVEEGVEYGIDNYIEHYNCKPPPLFIISITLIEIVIFAYYAHTEIGGVTAVSGVPLDSPLVFNPARRYEAWRFLAYMLLHQGYVHLISNLIFQLILGIPLEMVHKWWRVGIVYLMGVMLGSALHTVFDRYTLLVGASGGVYAIIGAHLAIVFMNWKEMQHEWMESCTRTIASAPVRLAIWACFVFADVGMALYTRFGTDEESRVSFMAHVGGLATGILIGVPVLRNLKRRFWEDVLFAIFLFLYIMLLMFVVVWNVMSIDYPTTDNRPCCPMPIITKGDIE